MTNPDSSHKDYASLGNTVTATDEAGAWKKYTMDAMGNLTQVEEPNPAGGSLFSYTYDALNHLITVSMTRSTGTQTRTFNYGTPPGAFLLSATNPELGTVSYTYSQSRLATKTDAKGQQVQYSYDTYGRISQVRHYLPVGGGLTEDTCQQMNYTYDSNGVGGFSYLSGRLATRSYSTCLAPNGTTTGSVRADYTDMFSYSQTGQVVKKRLHVSRTINTTPFPTTGQQDLDATWGYDGEGRMTSVSYPTGASGPAGGSYTFGFDSMGRPSTMSDTGATLISGTTYGPAGELLTMTGTGYSESRSYNSRLQLTALNGLSLSYPTANNGKISSQTDSVSAVSNGTWGQTYAYDGFGNLTAKTPAAGKTSATYSAAFSNNKETGLSYDANGNQISDVTNYGSLQYDVENRLVWGQKGSSSNGNGYGYDPSNRRVYVSTWTYSTQWNLSNEEVTFWGVGGQRMGTYSLSTSGTLLTATGYNVYFGSKLVRKIDGFGTAGAVQPDRLGSFGKFAPYGEERTSTADNTEKFATYYREGNTGLDYAMNRYYYSTSGRFMTADPYQASGGPGDPGSWNRYSYTRGDPANRVDHRGLVDVEPEDPDGPEDPDEPDPTKQPKPTPIKVRDVDDTHPDDAMTRWEGLNSDCRKGLTQALKQGKGSEKGAIYLRLQALDRALGAKDTLVAVAGGGNADGLDWTFLAAIGIRESGFVNKNELGGGKGIGVFQIDRRQHPEVTVSQASNLTSAATWAWSLLTTNYGQISSIFTDFDVAHILQATAASYNLGPNGFSGNPSTIDVGSPDANYGMNIMNLRECFR